MSLNTKTYSSGIFKLYASISVDTDLIEDRPGYSVDKVPLSCRRILVEGAGALVLKNNVGTDITFTCTAGQVLDVQASTIDSTTAATNIIVFW